MDEAEAKRGTDGPGATPEGAAGAGVDPWTGVQVGVGAHAVAYLWEWVGDRPSLRDAGLALLTEYCYTFFVRDDAGGWRELLRESVTTVAEDEKPKGRPLLHDGPSRAGEAIGVGLGVVGLLLDAHTWR